MGQFEFDDIAKAIQMLENCGVITNEAADQYRVIAYRKYIKEESVNDIN